MIHTNYHWIILTLTRMIEYDRFLNLNLWLIGWFLDWSYLPIIIELFLLWQKFKSQSQSQFWKRKIWLMLWRIFLFLFLFFCLLNIETVPYWPRGNQFKLLKLVKYVQLNCLDIFNYNLKKQVDWQLLLQWIKSMAGMSTI